MAWQCALCTFINTDAHSRCEICNALANGRQRAAAGSPLRPLPLPAVHRVVPAASHHEDVIDLANSDVEELQDAAAEQQQQQLLLAGAGNGQGSGSSAETAVAALAAAGSMPQQHGQPPGQQQQAATTTKQEPAAAEASKTSGGPAPLPPLDSAGSWGTEQQPARQQQQRHKRRREPDSQHAPTTGELVQQQGTAAAGLSPAGLSPAGLSPAGLSPAGLSPAAGGTPGRVSPQGPRLPPSKKQRLAATLAAAAAAGSSSPADQRAAGGGEVQPQQQAPPGRQHLGQPAGSVPPDPPVPQPDGSVPPSVQSWQRQLPAASGFAGKAALLLRRTLGLHLPPQPSKLLGKQRPGEQQLPPPPPLVWQVQQPQPPSQQPVVRQPASFPAGPQLALPPQPSQQQQQKQKQPAQQVSGLRLQQQPSAALAASHHQQQQQPQPKQASLRLPPRRSLTSPSPGKASPQGGRGAASPASQQERQQEQQQAGEQQLLLSPLPAAVVVMLEGGGEQQQQQQEENGQSSTPGQRRLRLGPQAWHQGMAALREQGAVADLPAGDPQRQLSQQPPSSAAATTCAVAAAASARPPPAWVQRARRAAQDVTLPLLAAAANCPPLSCAGPQAASATAPAPAWLAYRVAHQFPEAASCASAAELLQLGAAAAAAAAAAPIVLGAALAAAPLPSAATAEQAQQQQQQQCQLDMCQVAGLLLAASGHQTSHPMGFPERCNRWTGQRTAAVRKDIRVRLAAEMWGGGGGTGSSGCRAAARAAAAGGGGRGGGKRISRPPSRLGRPSAGEAGGRTAPVQATLTTEPISNNARMQRQREQREGVAGGKAAAGGACAPASVATQYKGVRACRSGGFQSCASVGVKQVWLGTYQTIEQGARAVDLAVAWRWLQRKKQRDFPTFNLPQNHYLQDEGLISDMAAQADLDALKRYIKQQCGASSR